MFHQRKFIQKFSDLDFETKLKISRQVFSEEQDPRRWKLTHQRNIIFGGEVSIIKNRYKNSVYGLPSKITLNSTDMGDLFASLDPDHDNDITQIEIKRWHYMGKLDRKYDLPAIEYGNKSKKWYRMGKHHRDGDKPAIDTDFMKEYYIDGKFIKRMLRNGTWEYKKYVFQHG
jgi:hypothetical protein